MAPPNARLHMNTELQNSSFGDIRGSVNSYNTQVYVFQDGNHADFRRFLSPLTPEERNRAVLERLTDGTGEWFLNSAEFRGWQDPDNPQVQRLLAEHRIAKRLQDRKTMVLDVDEGSGSPTEKDMQGAQILCCVGPPGIGKSSLASRVIERLQKDATNENFPILFFYCDHQDIIRQTSPNIVGVLLAQLVAHLSMDNPIVQELQTLHQRNQPLTTNQSRDYVDKIISASDFGKVCICLDALDELDPAIQDDVIRCCLYLCSRHPTAKLLLTGRDNAGVEAAVKNTIAKQYPHITLTVFPLTVEANAADVTLFLNEKISRDRHWSVMNPELRDEIMEKLECSTFLMASLRINAVLAKLTVKGRKENLEQRLATVDEAYAQTLERIRSQEEDCARFGMEIIRWMLFAKRRLSLEELRYAIAIQLGSHSFNRDEDLPPDSVSDFTLGLVTIERWNENKSHPRFFHYTLQEYLDRHRDEIFPDGHTQLALVTLTYFSFHLEGDEHRYDYHGDLYPFSNYATRCWAYHAIEGSTDAVVQFACNILRGQGLGVILRALDRSYISRTFIHCSALDVAAYFGATNILRALLRVEDARCTSPPMAAGKRESSEYVGNGRTPLSYAADGGNKDTVEFLLSRSDVIADSADNNGRTPLSFAAERGNNDIVELLLSRSDVVADSADENGRTPLSYAAGLGNRDTVQLLLSRDDVASDSADKERRTPLTYAAIYGNRDVVQLLLSRNDVVADCVDNKGRSPLSYAAESHNWPPPFPSVDTVRLFLQRNDVNINSADYYGQTPLDWAENAGDFDSTELLQSHGASRQSMHTANALSIIHVLSILLDEVHTAEQ